MAPNPPRLIGRFEIVKPLKPGGMGVPYLARDPVLQRLVVIKVPSLDSQELRDRFLVEVTAAARLNHRHIVTIHDVGTHEDQPFMTMEYIDGVTLADVIDRREPRTLDVKLGWILDLCSGLAYAHKAHIIHRDIKPANVMIRADDELKIVDFGLARIASENSVGHTQAGKVMGTLPYMAPEQVHGRQPAGKRADIFAVGLVLYELLSYRKARTAVELEPLFYEIVHAEPTPLHEVCDWMDPRLEDIVHRAIQKNPDDRYQSVEEMAQDLRVLRRDLRENLQRQTVVLPPRLPGRSPDGEDSAPPRTPANPRNLPGIAQRRAQQIEKHLAAALEHLDGNRFEEAIDACEQVILLDPQDSRALEVHERAERGLEDRRLAREAAERDERLQARLARVREAFASGSYEVALQVVDEALVEAPADVEALEVRRTVVAAIAERQRREEEARRAAEVGKHRAAALACLEGGQFEAAIAECEQALLLDARDSSVLDIRERAQRALDDREVSSSLAEVKAYVERGEWAEAETSLQKAHGVRPDAPEVRAARQALDDRRHAHQTTERIRELKSRAQEELLSGDLDAALETVNEAGREAPSDPEIVEMRRAVEAAIAERQQRGEETRRAAEVARHRAAALACLERGQFKAAIAECEQVLVLDARDVTVLDIRERARQGLDDQLVSTSLAKVMAHAERGEWAEAEASLKKAQEVRPDAPEIRAARQALKDRRQAHQTAERIRALKARARKELLSGALDAALQTVNEAGREAPSDPELVEMRRAVEAAVAKRQQRDEEARKAAEVATHRTAALGHFEQGQFDLAIAECDQTLLLDARDATVLDIRERARRALDDHEMSASLAEVRAHVERGEWEEAETLLARAEARLPGRADVRAMRRTLKKRRRPDVPVTLSTRTWVIAAGVAAAIVIAAAVFWYGRDVDPTPRTSPDGTVASSPDGAVANPSVNEIVLRATRAYEEGRTGEAMNTLLEAWSEVQGDEGARQLASRIRSDASGRSSRARQAAVERGASGAAEFQEGSNREADAAASFDSGRLGQAVAQYEEAESLYGRAAVSSAVNPGLGSKEPPPGPIHPVALDAVPWANVRIRAARGGVVATGTTPFVVDLPAGDYIVEFESNLAKPTSAPLKVAPTKPINFA